MMITSEVRGNQLFSTEDGMWRRPFEASASSMGPVPVGVPGRQDPPVRSRRSRLYLWGYDREQRSGPREPAGMEDFRESLISVP